MAKLGIKIIEAFENQNLCDVTILLADGSTVGAHRMVLKLGSDWFKTRLGENWDHSDPVNCTDFSAIHTRSVIEFLYKNDVELSIENVNEMLQASDFYMIPDLSDKCTDFLLKCISTEQVLHVLTTAHTFRLQNVLETALKYTDNFIEEVLSHGSNMETFCSLESDVIMLILKRDTCCIHEESMFNFVSMWISAQNRSPGIWKCFVPFIRFGCMSVDFFVDHVVYKEIITDDYALKIISYLTSLQVEKNILHGNACFPRQCMSVKDVEVSRFYNQSPHNTWTCDPLNGDRISFSVSEDVQLHGITLFGSSNASFLVEVSLHAMDNLIIKVKNRVEFSDKSEFLFSFSKLVQLQRDTLYTVCVNMYGTDVHFGIDGLKTVQTVVGHGKRVKVKFVDSLCSQTTVQRGQIKGLILR